MQNDPHPDLEFFVQEATSRLYIALELLKAVADDVPPPRGEDRMNGYEFAVLREMIEDVAEGLARAAKGPTLLTASAGDKTLSKRTKKAVA